MAGIDFMAIARGRQLARNENWQDKVRAQQEQKFAVERDLWQDQVRDRAINREAQAYTAPIITNMQAAASAGVTPTDYLIQQREQILADPNFQRFAPEVQQQVLSSIGQTVRAQLQDLQRTGDFPSTQRLAQAYGLISPATDIDVARGSGDVQQILNATNARFGSNLSLNPDGTVTVNGVNVPGAQLAYLITQAGGQGAAGLGLVGSTLAEQQRVAMENQILQMYGVGGVPPGSQPPTLMNPDGTPAAPLSSTATAFGGTPGLQPQPPVQPGPLAGAVQPTAPNTPNPLGGGLMPNTMPSWLSTLGDMLSGAKPPGYIPPAPRTPGATGSF